MSRTIASLMSMVESHRDRRALRPLNAVVVALIATLLAAPLGCNIFSNRPGMTPASVKILPPVASNLTLSTPEDTPLTVTLQASDPQGQILTFTVASGPSHGSLSAVTSAAANSAIVTYTPAQDFNGDDTLTFFASNSSVDGAPATVTITVTPVNDPPVITQGASITVAVAANSLAADPQNAFTLSATDVDAVGATLIWSVSTPAQHGAATVAGSAATASGDPVLFRYQPTAAYNGLDSFGVTVNDGQGGTASCTVIIGVGGFAISGTAMRVAAGGSTQPVNGLAIAFAGSGASAGFNPSATTDASGNYAAFVPLGWSGNAAATSPNDWVLTPASYSFGNVMQPVPQQNFSAARNYYVATTGSNSNPGTFAQPFRDPQTGAGPLLPGDSLVLMAGTYTGPGPWQTLYLNNVNGTASAPITIRTYQNPTSLAYDPVVLDGGMAGTYSAPSGLSFGMRLSNSSYIVLDGLTFANNLKVGLALGAGFVDGTEIFNSPVHDITVRNCVSHDNGYVNDPNGTSPGYLVVSPSHDLVLEWCEAYANCRGFMFGVTHQTNAAVLPYRITARYCHSHHQLRTDPNAANNSDGFTIACSRNVLFQHLVSHDNPADQITEGGPNADNNTWEYCVAYNGNAALVPNGDGNGFKIDNVHSSLLAQGIYGGVDHVVRYCVSFNNLNRGFEATEGSVDAQFYNNLCFGNRWWGFLTEGVRTVLRNNIGFQNAYSPGVYDNRYQGIYGERIANATVASADYNFWADLAGVASFTNLHQTSYDGIIEPHSLAGNPMFDTTNVTVDTNLFSGNPALHVHNPTFSKVSGLHLLPGSPCIDAGTFLSTTAQSGSATPQIAVTNNPTLLFRVGDVIRVNGVGAATILSLTAPIASPATPGLIGVDTNLTFGAGVGVSLDNDHGTSLWNGARPDMGPFESP